jgi:hypothetical protein
MGVKHTKPKESSHDGDTNVGELDTSSGFHFFELQVHAPSGGFSLATVVIIGIVLVCSWAAWRRFCPAGARKRGGNLLRRRQHTPEPPKPSPLEMMVMARLMEGQNTPPSRDSHRFTELESDTLERQQQALGRRRPSFERPLYRRPSHNGCILRPPAGSPPRVRTPPLGRYQMSPAQYPRSPAPIHLSQVAAEAAAAASSARAAGRDVSGDRPQLPANH